jgi:hypothetical protein
MGSTYDAISGELSAWISRQRIFFVATAPMSAEGSVNCSPKGLDTFRVLGPRAVAYLDLTGSGIETVAHLRENGRIVLMFCAFDGAPKIVRLHGRGKVLLPADPQFTELRPRFPKMPGVRSIIHVDLTRISTSCGFGVPTFGTVEDREQLPKYNAAKGEASLSEYRRKKNSVSIDGLQGIAGHPDQSR